jgi:hypothetical protein
MGDWAKRERAPDGPGGRAGRGGDDKGVARVMGRMEGGENALTYVGILQR